MATYINKNLYIQDAGYTLGEIIDSGSNSNGKWIKFGDGTMICWNKIYATGNQLGFTTNYGSIYYPDTAITWTYPISFYSSPRVELTSRFQGGVGGGVNLSSEPGTISSTFYMYYSKSFTFSSNQVSVECFAIGKWK